MRKDPNPSAVIYADETLIVKEDVQEMERAYRTIYASDPVELVIRHMRDGWKLRFTLWQDLYTDKTWLSKEGLFARSVDPALFEKIKTRTDVAERRDSDSRFLELIPS